jgi:hypothetical protein
MGRSQGASCREDVRARIAHSGIVARKRPTGLLRPLTSGSALGCGMGREIVRHYPHLSERIQGLARGAGLPFEALMELFLKAVSSGAPGEALSAEAAVALAPGGEGGGITVVRPLAESALPGSGWIVRRSCPEVGFASVEVTLPWLASAVAGVNEHGLAVAIAPCELASQSPHSDQPTAISLVQECLQRFSDIEGCADWCSKRPTSDRAAIAVAEASGSALVVEVVGDERRIIRGEPGLSLAGGSEVLRSRLRSQLAEGELGIDDPARIDEPPGCAGAVIVLEPGPRRLTLHPLPAEAGEAAIRFELPPTG